MNVGGVSRSDLDYGLYRFLFLYIIVRDYISLVILGFKCVLEGVFEVESVVNKEIICDYFIRNVLC